VGNIISRYGLSVEIPGELEEKGVAAVEAHVAVALDAECKKTFRVPLARLDEEVFAAIRAVPTATEEETAADPEGVAKAQEAAVKEAVDAAIARAAQRAPSLPLLAVATPAPAASGVSEDDDEEAAR
jgi:hypothetical protein